MPAPSRPATTRPPHAARRLRPRARIDSERIVATLVAADGLTGQRSTFDPRDVLRGVCEALPAGAEVDLSQLLDLGRQVIRHPDTVPLLMAAAPGQRAYSTTGMLAAEATALGCSSRNSAPQT